MLLEHDGHPGRGVRLAYCQNLRPAGDLEGVLAGLREISVPLAARLGGERLREGFGVGLWLPAHVALAMTVDEGEDQLDRLCELLADERLDAFTFNAFPYGGFHRAGLKEDVFRPSWKAPERSAYTLAVASIALAVRAALALEEVVAGDVASEEGGRLHTSISTHTGMHASWIEGDEDLDACADNLALMALHLAQVEDETGHRVVLALEPEPRSLAGDTRALPGFFERIRLRAREVIGRGRRDLDDVVEAILRRHLGTCLDACHAAVEFEEPGEALCNATASGMPLGKLQFSSALALAAPDADDEGRARLLALDEPVYLHQVTARRAGELVRAGDLPEVAAAWAAGAEPWRGCDEWRCHFHVPVDLEGLGTGGLGTTRAEADAQLDAVLAAPDRWNTHELHVEIETYTWDVLPREARGAGDLVDGLEREYRHVLARLAAAGWHPAQR
jgi:hypothetical protein